MVICHSAIISRHRLHHDKKLLNHNLIVTSLLDTMCNKNYPCITDCCDHIMPPNGKQCIPWWHKLRLPRAYLSIYTEPPDIKSSWYSFEACDAFGNKFFCYEGWWMSAFWMPGSNSPFHTYHSTPTVQLHHCQCFTSISTLKFVKSLELLIKVKINSIIHRSTMDTRFTSDMDILRACRFYLGSASWSFRKHNYRKMVVA